MPAMGYKKIDRETAQRIIETADIVDVVSDFVSLRRVGANYVGLCPFHADRNPSFHVSRAKGICKCFSCGKGGSAVNFIMEHEQLNYGDALRWLAKKYGIEIKEQEVTDEERAHEQERESMLALNDYAMHYYERVMAESDEGRDIGQAYFTERGINAQSIKRFHLGYSLERGNDFTRTALEAGYNKQFLLATGLCSASDQPGREGQLYDRFRGRVIYPVLTLSGRVVAFGARTLKSGKTTAKYVNSPESIIYSKSHELYGLYQAKQAIVKADKCILVEGYMDVISMHQSGVENVVASSGTALTDGQIRLIHRFTRNVTVIYDSDAAGIKASLRGIDLLLAQGMNIKVLSLPDGDDPDSYAQHHTSAELEQYLAEHEVDFIRFKSDTLLRYAGNDPAKRSAAIASILRSIACIPDAVTRQVYIAECAKHFDMPEELFAQRVQQEIGGVQKPLAPAVEKPAQESQPSQSAASQISAVTKAERELMRYVVRYGVMTVCDALDDEGNTVPMNVIDYIATELAGDELDIKDPTASSLWQRAQEIAHQQWLDDAQRHAAEVEQQRLKDMATGVERIRTEGGDMADLQMREKDLDTLTRNRADASMRKYARHYLEMLLASDPDENVRSMATDAATDRHQLSQIFTKTTHIVTDEERLNELLPRIVSELKNAILGERIAQVSAKIKEQSKEPGADEQVMQLMRELSDLNRIRGEFARFLGDRIITP